MDQKKIGSFLKELRKEKGITQEEFAEKLNVSGRTVSRWETGANMPDISLLVEISEFFDISIPEIINGERKDKKMNEEIKEVAKTLSDYANDEKEKMVREIRNFNTIGIVAVIIYGILQHSGLILQNTFFEKIALLCEIQIGISVIITFAHTTGILNRLQKKQKVNIFHTKLKNLPLIAQIIIAAIVAFIGASIIKLFLVNVLGL